MVVKCSDHWYIYYNKTCLDHGLVGPVLKDHLSSGRGRTNDGVLRGCCLTQFLLRQWKTNYWNLDVYKAKIFILTLQTFPVSPRPIIG